MRLEKLVLILVLVAGVLAGCGGETPAPTAEEEAVAVNVSTDESGAYVSAALDTSYEGALPASSQLAIGTLQLEETENAVAPQQAAALLPLWRAIQGGTLQNEAETNAVLRQIEGAMTSEQLAAIAAMQLTFDDMGTWAQEQGLNLRAPEATGDGEGGFAPPEGVSEEEREAMRATMEAGGMPSGDMSEEERAARRATAEASGITFPGGAGAGQLAALTEPLIELLTQRAVG
jgi:hypothetical protein